MFGPDRTQPAATAVHREARPVACALRTIQPSVSTRDTEAATRKPLWTAIFGQQSRVTYQ
jgi:hypothetical protein